MDISETLVPDSDQLDAIDLAATGPRTFTITKVTRGKDDQPVDIHLAEFPRVWRPGKSMRRVLAACWGVDASVYVGRRVTLFCDDKVVFGGAAVGGTRIRALSHIPKAKSIPLLVSRGKSAMFTVQPLAELTIAERKAELGAEWRTATAARKKAIEAEVAALERDVHPDDTPPEANFGDAAVGA